MELWLCANRTCVAFNEKHTHTRIMGVVDDDDDVAAVNDDDDDSVGCGGGDTESNTYNRAFV